MDKKKKQIIITSIIILVIVILIGINIYFALKTEPEKFEYLLVQ